MKNELEEKILGVRLFEDEKSISLVNGDSNTLIEIPKDTLTNTILAQDDLFSDWIDKLKDESWCPINILYQIADIIKETHPANTIDLDFQFFTIENDIYHPKFFIKIREIFDDYYSLPRWETEYCIKNIFALNDILNDEKKKFLSKITDKVDDGFYRARLNNESSSNMMIL